MSSYLCLEPNHDATDDVVEFGVSLELQNLPKELSENIHVFDPEATSTVLIEQPTEIRQRGKLLERFRQLYPLKRKFSLKRFVAFIVNYNGNHWLLIVVAMPTEDQLNGDQKIR